MPGLIGIVPYGTISGFPNYYSHVESKQTYGPENIDPNLMLLKSTLFNLEILVFDLHIVLPKIKKNPINKLLDLIRYFITNFKFKIAK